MAFSFHMIYNIDRRSVCGVISCQNKMGFTATNIRNIVFVHECYLYLWLMMKWRRKIIECALSSRKVDPPITTFLIFVANALTYQNHTHNSLPHFTNAMKSRSHMHTKSYQNPTPNNFLPHYAIQKRLCNTKSYCTMPTHYSWQI